MKKKIVDKEGFTKYFRYKPTALINKSLDQNTQDLRKSLDKIKQQKIKLNEDKRHNTNDKNKNNELNNMLSVIERIYQFFEYKFLPSEQSHELKLPKWIKVNKRRFKEILSTVIKAKTEGLRVNIDGREITLDNTESLLKDFGNRILNWHEFKTRYNDIVNDVEAIVNKPIITRNQEKMAEFMSLLKIIPNPEKSNKQPDTTDMPELESEESAAERRNQPGQGLKILTPDQMLSRLPITLAQLKAGNNSQNLINEIRQYCILCIVQENQPKQSITI